MIVTCPNCQTRYNLPDAKIPAGGAKVKCSKCAHVFKAELPPVMPEEEVESLLENESPAPDTKAGDAFEETFDDVASDGKDAAPAAEKTTPPADESPEEDMPGMDDLFDESEEKAPAPNEGASPTGSGDSAFGGSDTSDLFDDDDTEEETDDTSGLFDDDDSDSDDLFADGDSDDADEEDDDDDDDGEYDGLSLGDEPKAGNKKSIGCLIFLLIMALGLGGAIYFKVWTYAGIDLEDLVKNVPFVGQMFSDDNDAEDVPPGESPADRVRKIELKNVKQYYVANEKVGNLFVVEGKAVNTFAGPKEQIKVEVVLYDEIGSVLVSQTFLCGNVLSQFQLQVQTQQEVEDGLSSEVGILSNNTFIRPGASAPFMAVFFSPPAGVKEFLVKVVDVGDPE